MKDPEVLGRLSELKTEMVRRTADMLTAAAMESVKTLLSLQAETVPAAVRLGAARAVLELGIKVRETAGLSERIAKLEAQLKTST